MRGLLAILTLVGCTKAAPPEPPPVVPVDARVVDKIGPKQLDAGVPADASADDAAAPIEVTAIRPLAMAGPYKSLRDSCMAARPCGFTQWDDAGKPIVPATKPDCSAVLGEREAISRVPMSIGGSPFTMSKLSQTTSTGEIRIDAVVCAEPKMSRGEAYEHYAFVRRADGWWRTEAPLFTYSFNNKYCDGSMYLSWNTKPTRTIVGIAAAVSCLTCTKRGTDEDMVELMLRVEPGGDRPAVFAPVPVGIRTKTTIEHDIDDDSAKTDPDCKPGASATSLKERWLSDDEVELSGVPAAAGDPLTTTFPVWPWRIERLARGGRYKFTR